MGGGADRGGVDFGGHEEGYAVGSELVEEGGEEIHGLEDFDTLDVGVVVVVEGGDDEEDEVHEEAELLHPFAAEEFVVNSEC